MFLLLVKKVLLSAHALTGDEGGKRKRPELISSDATISSGPAGKAQGGPKKVHRSI
jgi:hypothetical protein